MKKTLSLFIAIAFCLIGYQAKAQMSYGGEPYTFKCNTISLVVPTVEVEALNADSLLADDAIMRGKGHALRIGVTKPVLYTPQNSGRIDILPDGGRIWRLAFHMEDATFTSMHFSKFNIPEGAELYFYSPDREFVIGKFTDKNQMEDGTFYPQEMPGEDIVVEYYEPANVPFHGDLAIDEISQGYYDFFHIYEKEVEGGIGTADGTCHPNAICYDAQWHDQINAVVCYTQTSGGYVYMCSGTLINNTAHNKKQYVLSANHCYEGGTWTFYFQYQATSCTGNNGSIYKTATGATVKARDNCDVSSDFMLVEITGTINQLFQPYLAGWNRSATTPSAPTSCGAIHHPGGDIKKFSVPQTLRNGAMVYSNMTRYWVTTWAYATGTTEQGSSGSALFNKDKLIVGQLYAGSSSCVNDGTQGHEGPSGEDFYGKLSNSWENNNATSNAKKLKPWLDPNNTGATTLQGEYLYGTSGIEESGINVLNAYPNPTTGLVKISGSFNEETGTCRVFDMLGNLVMNREINLSGETTLNLGNLSTGIYVIEVQENSQIFRTKISLTK